MELKQSVEYCVELLEIERMITAGPSVKPLKIRDEKKILSRLIQGISDCYLCITGAALSLNMFCKLIFRENIDT